MTLNILIAEDNNFTADQYNRILEKNGHWVTITHDGKECLKRYDEYLQEKKTGRWSSNPFDVVLLDNNMPEKNGAEVAMEILDKQPNQRIIFASAYDIDSLLKVPESIKDSVEILQKPFSLKTMVNKIQKNNNRR